jgi:hypothetical protein
MSIVDYKRRVFVLVEWAWAYFTWQRRSRVILEVPRELDAAAAPPDRRRLFSRPPPGQKLRRRASAR